MATRPLTKVMQDLRSTLLQGGAGLEDRQLLKLYIEQREDAAFAALVRRHGPLVWGICRRVLSHHQDAEDAFQATFLVLARKAASIRAHTLLAGWLHSVAHRTALRARSRRGKERSREKQVTTMPEREAPRQSPNDLRPLLDRELVRLPEKYYVAVLLCDLEGKTGKEAARQLQIPEVTLTSRLRTARLKLARALTRRGVTLSTAALTVWLSQQAASASVPAELTSSTIKFATLAAAGPTGLISANVAALAQGVMKAMLLHKLKLGLGVLLAVFFLGGVGTWIGVSFANRTGESVPAEGRRVAGGTVPKVSQKEDEVKEEKKAAEIDPQVAEAWRKAGSNVGWYWRYKDEGGFMELDEFAMEFGMKRPKNVNALPAFENVPRGGFANLPAPAVPFVLHMERATDEQIKGIGRFKNLRVLCLQYASVTDAGLKELAGLENLRSLSLSSDVMTDAGLKEIAKLKSLERLDLFRSTKVTDAGMKELVPLKKLADLNLFMVRQVTDAGLQDLGKITCLRKLDLARTGTTDAGLKNLAGLTKLQVLYLGETNVSNKGLKDLARLTNLEALDLSELYVSNEGVKELAKLRNLKTLGLNGTAISDGILQELAGHTNLEVLNIGRTRLTDAGLKGISGFKKLHTLSIGFAGLTDEGLKELASLDKLSYLDLWRTRITDAGLKELTVLTNLHTLRLGLTRITDSGLKEVAKMKSIRSVFLSEAKVTPAGVDELRRLRPDMKVP